MQPPGKAVLLGDSTLCPFLVKLHLPMTHNTAPTHALPSETNTPKKMISLRAQLLEGEILPGERNLPGFVSAVTYIVRISTK